MKIFTRIIPESIAKIALEISNDKISVTEEGYESAVTASRRLLAVVYFGILFVGYTDIIFDQNFSIDIYVFVIVTSLTILFALLSLRKRINERTNSTEYDLYVEDEFFFALITFQVGIFFLILIITFRALAEPIASIIPINNLTFSIPVPIFGEVSINAVIFAIYITPYMFYIIENDILPDSVEEYGEDTDSSKILFDNYFGRFIFIINKYSIKFKPVVVCFVIFNFGIFARILPSPYGEIWLVMIVIFVPIGLAAYKIAKPVYLSIKFIWKTINKNKCEFIDEAKYP